MLNVDLSGRTALVTGATGELGRVIARTLAGCGARVVVHYHVSEARAGALVGEIGAAGGRAVVAHADVTDPASVNAMRDRLAAEHGAEPDVLVHNAVIQYPWRPVLEQPLADFEGQYRSCVAQSVLLAQAFAPAMLRRGWGRVIAINTECALQCLPGQGAYVSGKRGMDGVLRVLAREIGPQGVTVNQVAPGWMVSDKYRESGTERQEAYEKTVPLRRRGEDRDVAHAVAFLASDLAGFVTGAFLPVSGGSVMPAI